jgi:ribosomal protein S18 acetylase RimI-like enzyme
LISGSLPWTRYGITYDGAVDRLTTGLRQGAAILVAVEAGDKPVGFVWIVPRGAFDLSGYIRWIVVDPSQRGGGIGRLLLDAAESRIRQTGRDIFLLCSDFNVDARRFYERYGYLQVGAMPDYVLPGVTEIIYRKRL